MATADPWLDGGPGGERLGEHVEGEDAAIVLSAGGCKQWNVVRGGARLCVGATKVAARE